MHLIENGKHVSFFSLYYLHLTIMVRQAIFCGFSSNKSNSKIVYIRPYNDL